MIIENKNYFGELAQGERFFLADKTDKRLFIKTETTFSREYYCFVNAVSLNDGVFHSYDNDVEVIPVSAKRVSK